MNQCTDADKGATMTDGMSAQGNPVSLSIGLVGYGEVGKILAAALVDRGVAWVGAWDLLLRDPAAASPMREHARGTGAEPMPSLAALLARADVVVSAVTASQTLAVAAEAAPEIRPGTWFVDLNSASPETKVRSGELVDAAGGRYVESAVMTSVPPHGIKVPMLLGGRFAADAQALLAPLGFNVEAASPRLGVASAIKMCRSVVIKGLEALVVESFTSARAYGVEDRVLASLHETFPGLEWDQLGTYLFSRAALHGKRRAEEMREVAATVRDIGLEPLLASATAERQDWMGVQKEASGLGQLGKDANWREYADRLLQTLAAARQSAAD
jgi:3-hydroxyisobutyrate dehydrogenase-like beta-hydroxyacid dehydrogenase